MALSEQTPGGMDTGDTNVGGAGQYPRGGGTGQRRRTDRRSAGGAAPRSAVEDVVELTVPALVGYLGVVRTATAGLAARLAFTLDEIEDLRIAVDEACVMLLSLARPRPPDASTLTCRFRVYEDVLAVSVSAPVSPKAVMPAEQSFAWQVLTAHATEVTGHAAAGRAAVELLKRRQRR